MNQKYYLSKGLNNPLKLPSMALICMLLIFIWAPIGKYLSKDLQVIYYVTVISLIILLVLFTLKRKITGIELTQDGFKLNYFIWLVNIANFSSNVKRIIKWDQIQGLIISQFNFSHKKSKFAKIILKKSKGNPTYLMLDSAAFEKGNELFEYLQNKVPGIKNDHEMFAELLKDLVPSYPIHFNNMVLTGDGVKHSGALIPWNRIRVIDYEDYNRMVSGLGAINVTYHGREDKLESFRISPKGTEQFREILINLIKKANDASIDPSLLKIFNKKHQREGLFLKLFVIFVVIFMLYMIIKIFT